MRSFEFFVKNGRVRRRTPDTILAGTLLKDAQRRLGFARRIPITREDAKFVFESTYESIREATDALLALHGYSSYSHEASIAFLQGFTEFSSREIAELDRYRMMRNDLKYHGKDADKGDAREVLGFAEAMFEKITSVFGTCKDSG